MKKRIITILIAIFVILTTLVGCRSDRYNSDHNESACITPIEFLAMSETERNECKEKINTGECHFTKLDWNGKYYINKCASITLDTRETFNPDVYNMFIDALTGKTSENSNSNEIGNNNEIEIRFKQFLEDFNYCIDVLTVGCVKGGVVSSTSGNLSGGRNFWGIIDVNGSYHSSTSYVNDYFYVVTDFRYNGHTIVLEISNTDYDRMYKHFSESSEPIKFDVYFL